MAAVLSGVWACLSSIALISVCALFHQVLIHLNLRQSASPPPAPPPEEPRQQSIQRVQFSVETAGPAEEAELPPPSYDDLEQEPGRANTLGELAWTWLQSGWLLS